MMQGFRALLASGRFMQVRQACQMGRGLNRGLNGRRWLTLRPGNPGLRTVLPKQMSSSDCGWWMQCNWRTDNRAV